MAISITHPFVSGKSDGPDTTVVQPSDWNDAHTFTCAADSLLGRGGSSGAVQEISCTSFGRDVISSSGNSAAVEFGIVPLGAVLDYAGASAPTGWLLCYGQAISRSTYSALFSILSTTYGVGDGSTTFNLPDLRGRVVAGQDDMGGSSANRLTDQTGGLNGDTLGATGGAETHTLTDAQMPTHTHVATSVVTDPGHDHVAGEAVLGGSGGGTGLRSGTSTSPSNTSSDTTGITVATTNANTGSGSAHNNVQPTIILNKIIYVGV